MFGTSSFKSVSFLPVSWAGLASGVVTYMRPPSIEEDDQPRFSTMDICRMWTGAQQSGIASGPLVDSQ